MSERFIRNGQRFLVGIMLFGMAGLVMANWREDVAIGWLRVTRIYGNPHESSSTVTVMAPVSVAGAMTLQDDLILESGEYIANSTDKTVAFTYTGLGPTWGTMSIQSDRIYTNVADGDDFIYDMNVRNDSNETIRLARWTYDFTDVSSNSEDATITLSIPIAGTATEVLKLDANGLTAAAGLVATINTNALIVTDYGIFGGAVTSASLRVTGAASVGTTLGVGTTLTTRSLSVGDSASISTNVTIGGACNVGGVATNASLVVTAGATIGTTLDIKSRSAMVHSASAGLQQIVEGFVTMGAAGTNTITFSPVFTDIPYVFLSCSNGAVGEITNQCGGYATATNTAFVFGDINKGYFYRATGKAF